MRYDRPCAYHQHQLRQCRVAGCLVGGDLNRRVRRSCSERETTGMLRGPVIRGACPARVGQAERHRLRQPPMCLGTDTPKP